MCPPERMGKGATGLLVEPWEMIDQAGKPPHERAATAKERGRRLDPETCPVLGLDKSVTKFEEFEICYMFLLWSLACCTPIFMLLLPFLPLSPSAMIFIVCVVGVTVVYPNGDWPLPPENRWTMPLRNQKLGRGFMRYFPMRCIVEDDAVLDSPRPVIFGGVPHGMFPIGMLILALCNFALPFRWSRGAAASILFRLPIWRQVLRWNGGIDVSKAAITSALANGDNVIIAMDGIAGMFAADRGLREGKEVFLLTPRKGLCRVALQTGAPLVPFVCFGNTKACKPFTDPCGFMAALSRLLRVSLIWPSGRWGLPVPHRTPVTIVLGSPLIAPSTEPIAEPTDAQVDLLHDQLLKQVEGIYYRWRRAAGYGGVELVVA